MKHNNQSTELKKSMIMVMIISVALFSVIGYGTYQKLFDYTKSLQLNYQNSSADLNLKLDKFIRDSDIRHESLSNKVRNLLTQKDAMTENQTTMAETPKQQQIIKYLNDQNRLISKLLKHSAYLDENIERLSKAVNAHNPQSEPGIGESDAVAMSADEAPAIENLEEEIAQSTRDDKNIIKQIDDEFARKSQDSHLLKVNHEQIIRAIDEFEIDKNFSIANKNIECRESMCKIEFSSVKSNSPEMQLSMELSIGLANQLESYTLTEKTDINPDGSNNATFYVSVD